MKYRRKTKPALWTTVPGAKPTAIIVGPKCKWVPLDPKKWDQGVYKLNAREAKLCKRVLRRVPVRPVSAARAAQKREDARLLAAWWPSHRFCLLYPQERAADRHHCFGKVGRLLTETRLWVPLSRKGHDWVERHRPLARAIGLLCPAGHYNTMPDEASIQRHEYRVALFRWLNNYQEESFPANHLIPPMTRMEIQREVLEAFPKVRATL